MPVTAELLLQNVAAPIVVAVLFILATSRVKEPNRRHFMAIMIAGAGAAYLSGPIIPFLPTSSIGCAVCDPVIAAWCFDGAPCLNELRSRRCKT